MNRKILLEMLEEFRYIQNLLNVPERMSIRNL